MKHRIKPIVFSGLLALAVAAPALAVSPNSTWSAFRTNSGGTTFFNMAPSANAFCFLSKVSFTDIDTGEEKATCRVTRGPVVWTLEAIMGASSDADLECAAYCYNN